MKAQKVKNTGMNLILAVFSVLIIYPLLWLVSSSLKDRQELYIDPWNLLPSKILFQNYMDAWVIGNIGKYLANTVIVTAATLFLLVILCYLASYALARLRFTGRNAVMVLFVSTMMLPVQVLVIPLFKVQSMLHISNSLPGLILAYTSGGLPFSIFVLTAFLKKIPREMDEAAYIDGCRRLQMVWSVLLPLSRPGLATVIIFTFMNVWNEFFLALVFIQDPAIKTLTLGILNFAQQWGQVDYNRQFAALVIINAPVIIVYVVFQKQFINGLTAGALKA